MNIVRRVGHGARTGWFSGGDPDFFVDCPVSRIIQYVWIEHNMRLFEFARWQHHSCRSWKILAISILLRYFLT